MIFSNADGSMSNFQGPNTTHTQAAVVKVPRTSEPPTPVHVHCARVSPCPTFSYPFHVPSTPQLHDSLKVRMVNVKFCRYHHGSLSESALGFLNSSSRLESSDVRDPGPALIVSPIRANRVSSIHYGALAICSYWLIMIWWLATASKLAARHPPRPWYL